MSGIYKINAAGGMRVPVVAGNPSVLENGLIWYDSNAEQFKKYEDGQVTELSAGQVAAQDVSFTADQSTLAATNARAAIEEVQGNVDGVAGDLGDHEAEATGAHAATAISYDATGDDIITAATTASAAIKELDAALDGHISQATGAHAASAISFDDTSTEITATTAQAAIAALDTLVDGKIDATEKGQPDGVATLDGSGRIPSSQLTIDAVEYKGTWDASTNTPTLADGTGTRGDLYRVSSAGSQNLGSGSVTYAIADKVVYNGSIWEKWKTSEVSEAPVDSVNGEIGVVVLDSTHLDHTQAVTANWTVADGSTIAAHLDELASRTAQAESDLGNKLEAVQDDTAPALGGNLSTGTNVVIHGADGLKIGSSATDFFEEEYHHALTLTASQTDQSLSALTFAHAEFEGLMIDYKIKEASTNRVRIGQLMISTNGTDTSIVDTLTETGNVGVSWSLLISGADVLVRYTTTANDKTMRCTVKRIKT
jgi:hypothetical protein